MTEFRVNTFGADTESSPAVAVDADGDFVVTWMSSGQGGSGADIYAQRYNAAGVAQGGEFRVNTTTDSREYFTRVAMDADGDFVVTWQSYRDGSGWGIYAQRYNAAGMAQGGEFRVNTTMNGELRLPAVAMDADGDFVLAWQSYGQDGSYTGIYAQRYNAAGVARGSEFRVNTTTVHNQRDAAIAMDADGDFVVAWQSYGQDGSFFGIYAQRYNAAGVAQGGEFRVNTTTAGHQRDAAIAMDADGDFVVTWVSGDGSWYGIYAQRYNTAGVAHGGEFRVNTTTADFQLSPAVAMDADGDFVVTWQSRQDGSGAGIYAQRYNAAGVAQGGEFRVNTTTANNQLSPAVAMDADGDFVVTWDSQGQAGANWGTYAQRYNAAGVPQGGDVATLLAPISPGLQVRVTQVPGAPSHSYDLHHGWDFVLHNVPSFGAPVVSVAAGRVVFVKADVPDGGPFQTVRDDTFGPPGALGNVVTIEHTFGARTFYSSYIHLKYDTLTRDLHTRWQASLTGGPDVFVSAGEVIGAIGNTGYREGTHLHLNLGTQSGSYETRINGVNYIFSDYQIAKGAPDDPILSWISFRDAAHSDGLFRTGERFSVGDPALPEGGEGNAAPSVTGDAVKWLQPGQVVVASDFVSVSDPDGLAEIAFIRFWDATPGHDGGFLTLDGARISGSTVAVPLAQLSRVAYEAGPNAGSNGIVVEASDRRGAESNEFKLTFQVGEVAASRAPVITVTGSLVMEAGSTTPLSRLIGIGDPDGFADLRSIRLLDVTAPVGGFTRSGSALGADSGWLPVTDFTDFAYAAAQTVGDDAVSVQLRDAAGNVVRRDLVIQVRPEPSSSIVDRLPFQEVQIGDPSFFNAQQWASIAEWGTTLAQAPLEALSLAGQWGLDQHNLGAAGVRIFHVSDMTVSQIQQIGGHLDVLAAAEVMANYANGAVNVVRGGDVTSELYLASRDSLIGLASGMVGKATFALGTKALLATGLVYAGAPVVIVAVGAVILAVGAEHLMETYFPETTSGLVDVVSSAPRNFINAVQSLVPFLNGSGGGEDAGAAGTSIAAPEDLGWTLDLDTGEFENFSEELPQLWSFTLKRFGIGDESLETGLLLIGDRNSFPSDDVLIGSPEARDTLIGQRGDDQLFGLSGDDRLEGGEGDDVLDASAGADTLIGGSGADTMDGGTGDDLFFVMDTGDVVLELAHGGADTIITAINLNLPDHVEALRIAEGVSGIIITGGAGNDVLIGNGLANNFNGGAGDDVILAGNVTLADIYALFAT